KWYQRAIRIFPPRLLAKMCAMPTANAGAPPVRLNNVRSPTACAKAVISVAVTGKPHEEIVAVAAAGAAPTTPAGLLSAKYTPGCSTQAAIVAMMATNDSAAIAP